MFARVILRALCLPVLVRDRSCEISASSKSIAGGRGQMAAMLEEKTYSILI